MTSAMTLKTWSMLLAFFAVSLLPQVVWAAAQDSNASLSDADVCAGAGTAGARIVVGRTNAEKVTLVFDDRGGTCDYKYVYYDGLVNLSIFGPNFSSQSVIGEHGTILHYDCPALVVQTAKLRPSKGRGMHVFRGSPPPAVQIGPFSVTDLGGYFDLQSPEGRRDAAEWIRETLAVVRPCWKMQNGDPNFILLTRLYGDLGMRSPRQVPSPEALARETEDGQLQIATSGEPPPQYQPQQLASGHPQLDVGGVTVDRVERASNGPDTIINLDTKLHNVGMMPVDRIWAHLDLIPFLHFGEHSLAQRKMNACEEVGPYTDSRNLTDHVVLPAGSIIIHINEKDPNVFYQNPDDDAYGDHESDFLVVIGCIKYAYEYRSPNATLTFAYVIGKHVDNKFLRFSRGDGVLVTKSLKLLDLNQDYR